MKDSITKGCVIDCELIYYPRLGFEYVPAKVLVIDDSYHTSDNGAIYHLFNVKILETDSSNRFHVGEIVEVRASDLYSGQIVDYPHDYDKLVEEKKIRKKLLTYYPC